tara:strand:+ start:3515 stop:3814 length:300 start_codon:yes stop_codon:yes gene_type:complete
MDRYKHARQLKDDNGYRYRSSTVYPVIPPSRDDIYIISREGDRLDILANKYYNDISKWWIIAIANNLGKGTTIIEPGLRLRIPMDIMAYHEGLERNNKR